LLAATIPQNKNPKKRKALRYMVYKIPALSLIGLTFTYKCNALLTHGQIVYFERQEYIQSLPLQYK